MTNSSITPHHIGIIMDGNGRWAQAQGQNRLVGHQVSVESAHSAVMNPEELE